MKPIYKKLLLAFCWPYIFIAFVLAEQKMDEISKSELTFSLGPLASAAIYVLIALVIVAF